MGKTVEFYHMALDREVQRWSGFARALRKEEKLVFDQLIEVCRNFASAGTNVTRPVMFEAMVMSILLHQQKALNKLEKMVVGVSNQSK